VPSLHAALPPLILAATGPTKVQPPSEDTVSSPNDITSLLSKDQQTKPESVTVVLNQEQPVDLVQQSKAQASAGAKSNAPASSSPTIAPAPLVVVAAPPSSAAAPADANAAYQSAPAAAAPQPQAASNPTPSASTTSTQSASAPAVAAPLSRSIAPAAISPVASSDVSPPLASTGSVNQPAAPAPPSSAFPEPKRVKTLSVRADGSLIGAASPAEELAPPTSQTPPADAAKPASHPMANAADAEPTTPKLDLPAKPSAKSTARVPIAKMDTTAATATSQSPEAPLQISPLVQRESASKKHDAATHVASAEPVAPPPTLLPNAAAAAPAAPDAKPSRVTSPRGGSAEALLAPASSASGSSASGADYAVQLAAPASEAEARSASAHLKAKFAGELGGAEPVIHKADLQGRTVYRVRVGGFTKADAVALCEKLKAAGGACFIAHE
jgi:sporulation related protein